jgi:hypothetical protein
MENEADFEKAGDCFKVPVPETDIPVISGLFITLWGSISIQYGV